MENPKTVKKYNYMLGQTDRQTDRQTKYVDTPDSRKYLGLFSTRQIKLQTQLKLKPNFVMACSFICQNPLISGHSISGQI